MTQDIRRSGQHQTLQRLPQHLVFAPAKELLGTFAPSGYSALIIQAYRQKGVKVTRKVVEEANPTMNPNRLLRGQKVFIPDPAK